MIRNDFTHHEKGQLTSIQAPGGENEALTWDGFLPTGETWSGPVSGSLSRTFDNNFRATGISVDGQSPVSFTYDADGLLTGAGGLTLARDPQTGLLTGSTLGSVTDSRTYTSYGELDTYSAAYPAGLSFQDQYTRDAAGRIIQKVETINGTETTYGYSYDQDGRLTDVTVNGSAYSHYGYDSNGNRTSYTGPSGSVTGTYDAQDRMLTYGSDSYTYTANGELASKTDSTNGQVTQYSYDVLGNLRQVVLPDGTNIQYIIDGRNRRVGKEVNGTLTQAWLYDGQLRPVAELDGSGNVVSSFLYATHVNVPDLMIKGGVTYRIITDHLGSPRFIIDQATGTIAERLDYDAFGNVLLDTNPGFQPFGFAGGLYDSQTGLVRFGARDYDAQSGRWTSKDSLLFYGESDCLYGYVGNDPVNYFDPTGLFCIPWFAEPMGDWGISEWGPERYVVQVSSQAGGFAMLAWSDVFGWVEQSREVRQRKLCFGTSCYSGAYDAWFEYGPTTRETRTLHNYVSRTALSGATGMFAGGDPEAGDQWLTNNPFTGQPVVIPAPSGP